MMTVPVYKTVTVVTVLKAGVSRGKTVAVVTVLKKATGRRCSIHIINELRTMNHKIAKGQAYKALLGKIVSIIEYARLRTAYALNSGQIQLYFEIGRVIVEKQEAEGWGKSIVVQLSKDICSEMDIAEGFSPENLWKMRQFFLVYRHLPEQLKMAKMIPWGQNIVIISKIKNENEITYYLKAVGQMGWSRNVLLNQIKSGAYKNHKLLPKQHNFQKALPTHS